jgi:GNAT superfamily N-acetyltransferase
MRNNIEIFKGIWQFGKEYGIMFKNDTHAEGSVDRSFYKEMIKLTGETVDYLYNSYTPVEIIYEKGSRIHFEKIVSELKSNSDRQTVHNIVAYCRDIVEKCETRSKDMIFGGREEEIIDRGTYWCTDIARVACILCQVDGLQARILITANTKFAYCGHTVVEVHYDNKWGVIDPTNGLVFEQTEGYPASAWDIKSNPEIVNAAFNEKYGTYEDLFAPGEQYESVAIVNYYVNDSDRYDYKLSRLNEYVAGILAHSREKWAGGIRWIHNEERPNLSIKKAAKEDLKVILEMERLWEAEDITYGLACGTEEDLYQFLEYAYIALWHGIPIGYVLGSINDSKELCVFDDESMYLVVEEIYVYPSFRGEDVGSNLLDHIINQAKKYGIKNFKIYSATKETDKIMKFYNKKGFKPWYVVMYKTE